MNWGTDLILKKKKRDRSRHKKGEIKPFVAAFDHNATMMIT